MWPLSLVFAQNRQVCPDSALFFQSGAIAGHGLLEIMTVEQRSRDLGLIGCTKNAGLQVADGDVAAAGLKISCSLGRDVLRCGVAVKRIGDVRVATSGQQSQRSGAKKDAHGYGPVVAPLTR